MLIIASYHAVHPVLNQALGKVDIIDTITLKLQVFTFQMALQDKMYGKEKVRLLKFLKQNGIDVLPYKGYFFTEKLYKGQHFRESGDMDLVIQNKS